MGMLEKLIITAIVETTAGTLEADSVADAIKFTTDTKPPKTGVKFIENPEGTGSLSPSKGYIGPKEGGFDVTMLLRGSGYCDVAPQCGKFLKSCGFVEVQGTGGAIAAAPAPTTTVFTVTGADLHKNDIIMVDIASGATANYEIVKVTDVTDDVGAQEITVSPALTAAPTATKAVIGQITYKPTSVIADMASLSVYHYMDGIKVAQNGCRGSVKFDFKWGEMAKAVFGMSPLAWTASTADAGFTPDFSTLQAGLPCMGGSFRVSGTEEYVESLSLDLGAKVPALGAIQTTGYYENFIGARAAKGSFDPFAKTADHLTAFMAGTSGTIWLKFGSASNIFVMNLPDIQRESVDFADREKINTYKIGYRAYGVSGDDDVLLAFCSPTPEP